MSIILVVTSFVGEDTGAVDRTTRVVMAFFFFISAALLGADQNNTIERITVKQAADFITEPRDPYQRSNRRKITPTDARAASSIGALSPAPLYQVQKLCQELLAFLNNHLARSMTEEEQWISSRQSKFLEVLPYIQTESRPTLLASRR
jgi:hypothetical protein